MAVARECFADSILAHQVRVLVSPVGEDLGRLS